MHPGTFNRGWIIGKHCAIYQKRRKTQRKLFSLIHLHDMATELMVACVGGGFAVLVALISKIGSDNKKDHGQVHNTLGRIEQKIDGHLEGHK
jgi:methylmalonyl-CoA mutase N-terminal domain/subunit